MTRACAACVAAVPRGVHGWPAERATAADLARAGRALFQCRARPPVIVPHADDEPETLWPTVTGADWCMSFKPAPVEAAKTPAPAAEAQRRAA